tara:strand:+ start:654 stop:824 length:171 start_codon:yes stop_codon:yes gene_type:complete
MENIKRESRRNRITTFIALKILKIALKLKLAVAKACANQFTKNKLIKFNIFNKKSS